MASAVPERVISTLVVGSTEELEFILPIQMSCQVDRVQSPAEAILRLAGKAYDLVMIDHSATGDVTDEQLSYLRALRAIRPGSKAIVLVAHTTTRKVIEALHHGMFAYFSRPLDLSAVKEAVEQALSMQQWSDGIEVLSTSPDFVSVRLRCCLHTVDRLAQFMKELPSTMSNEERDELSMAFREMLLNAIEHGGKLDPNEWVDVSRVRTKRAIVYHIRDPGEGFSREDLDHAAISNPPDLPTAHIEVRMAANMRPGGFGMLIASHSVDEVIYNQSGNEVILIKHLD